MALVAPWLSVVPKRGTTVLQLPTDVSKIENIEFLAQRTFETFGGVHLLFNNAGVAGGRRIWESTLADWEWLISVNLTGAFYCIRTFVPIMLKLDCECHIVNTASSVAFKSSAGAGIYKVTKHGILTLSETLFHELTQLQSKIGVSVLCPGVVSTRIGEAERNRPARLRPLENSQKLSESDLKRTVVAKEMNTAMAPEAVVDHVFRAIRRNQFYILTHPEAKIFARSRMEDILAEHNPTFPAAFHE